MVAFNRFASDTDEEVEAIRRHCEEDLANLVVETIEKKPSAPLQYTYGENDTVQQKIEKVACNLYGASVVTYSSASRKMMKLVEEMGMHIIPSA